MQLDTCSRDGRSALQGEWVTARAIEGLKLLAGELELILGAEPKPSRIAIDLAQLTELDACGCQLLAVYLGNLKRHGIAALPCRIPSEIMDEVRLLGFADALAVPDRIEKESA